MKTNLLKTAVLFAALSFTFIACEKETLGMEAELKKVKPEQILPNKNQNDKELQRELLEELPILESEKTLPKTTVEKSADKTSNKGFETLQIER